MGHAGPANQLAVGTHVGAGQAMSSIGPGIVVDTDDALHDYANPATVRGIGRSSAELLADYSDRLPPAEKQELTGMIKSVEPTVLVGYANFPSTEYLETDFTDFLAFNVYVTQLIAPVAKRSFV